MNEKAEPVPQKGLEEAPAAFRSPDPPEHPTWRADELRGADLRGRDLTAVEGLLPEHLAGTDLTGAKLPDGIANFPALGQVGAISSEARKVFIGLLAACVYSWLVIGTTTDVALIVNTASSPLPIINTPIPIAGFYVIGATLLAAVYCYFHFYLQRLWRTLATLPAVFPDGTPLDDKTDPWLLTNLVRADFKQLRKNPPPLTRLENLLTILLAWWLVPLTLVALWARYLPAHYWLGTTWLVALIGITALFGRHSYRLAGATLRGETPVAAAQGADDRGVPGRAWHEFRQIRPDRLTVGLITVLTVCSLSAFRDNPRDPYTWVAKGLNAIGIRTYADLREVNVAERPDGWDGQDWSKVKRVDLRDRNIAFADATRAFLANADLRRANLSGAVLAAGAQLQGADLRWAQLQSTALWAARLQGAHLGWAELQGADLSWTQLQSAYLIDAQLQDVDLRGAQLRGAVLHGAQLQRANLINAKLQDANLRGAQLQGAELGGAELQQANLTNAQLQRADLRRAQLEGADFSAAQLEGANLSGAQLKGAILREAQLRDTNLTNAQLQGANLTNAQLQGAILQGAKLQGAVLWGVQLQGASLGGAELQGANLTNARLQAADLRRAQLQGADLRRAQLQGADLRRAQLQSVMLQKGVLQGANLTDAQLQGAVLVGAQLQGTLLQGAQLQGADLRAAALWRVLVADAEWYLADLSGTDVKPIAGSKIDDVIKEPTLGVPEEASRRALIGRLETALKTATRPDRPDFPAEWRSVPNVMFKPGNPEPEPLDWGPIKWTAEAYDENLAKFLGDLACGRDVPGAQTVGLAVRALYTDAVEPSRVWPVLFANQVTGADCPPAKGLREDMRRRLEQLATRRDAAVIPPDASPPDPVE